jgi:DNA damage-binding protein 2
MASTEAIASDPKALAVILLRKRSKSIDDTCTFCGLKTTPPHDYATCPTRPCYLCRKMGHQQLTCPYRLLPGAQERALKEIMMARARKSQSFHFLRAVELGRAQPIDLHVRSPQIDAKVVAAVRRAHGKRITSLEFIPGEPTRRLISGDKSGGFAIWDFGVEHVHGKYGLDVIRASVHHCNVNAFQFDGSHTVISTSSDGRVCRTNLDVTGTPEASDVLLNLNPKGWLSQATWRMAYGMAAIRSGGGGVGSPSLLVGDDVGNLFTIDPRSSTPAHSAFKAHKKKIQHIDSNPVRKNLVCTGSNDQTVRMWDTRMLGEKNEVAVLKVGTSVASACFSPITGRKLLVTSLANAILVYNDVDVFGSDVAPTPDHNIVHGHQYNRYISVAKGVWDPKDVREDLFMCGRYLGEAYNVPNMEKAMLLHPVDLFSASKGTLISSLVDSTVHTVCPVNRFHPSADLIVSGTSLNLFMWGVANQDESEKDTDGAEVPQEEEGEVSHAEKKRRVASQVPQTVVQTRSRRTRARR